MCEDGWLFVCRELKGSWIRWQTGREQALCSAGEAVGNCKQESAHACPTLLCRFTERLLAKQDAGTSSCLVERGIALVKSRSSLEFGWLIGL